MSDEYTPTDRLRDVILDFADDYMKPHRQRTTRWQRVEEALATHDRAVKAAALREAAYRWGDATWQDVWAADGVEDDVSAVQSTVRWLNARAAELEADQ